MAKLKHNIWKRASFSIKLDVINALNAISRTDVPNKSKLIESLIITWLTENDYITSGSL